MIVALLWFGGQTPLPRLVAILAWGSVVGSALQLAVQLPVVLRVAPQLRFAIDTTSADVRTIVGNFFPAFVSRGVVQLSAYIDTQFASYLPIGAVAGLTNAATLTPCR
jgi:putative peptidoglycan lipid II flippase